MSVEAISWARGTWPRSRPAGAGGHPVRASTRRPGNHAGPGGTGAFPSVATLVRLYRAVGAHGPYLPGPAGGRGHHRTLRPGHRRGADQARRSPPAGPGPGPEPDPDDLTEAALRRWAISSPACARGRGGPCPDAGEAAAPELSMEPSREPSAASARGREGLPAADGAAGGGGRAGSFLDGSDQDCKESVSDGSWRCDDAQHCHQRHSHRRG